MSKNRRVAIVGAAESDLGFVPNTLALELAAQAAKRALEDAGLSLNDVDGVMAAGPFAYMQSLTVADYLGIRPTLTDSTSIGGSSFLAHLGHAALAIQEGLAEVVLITYGSVQRSSQTRVGSRGMDRSPFEDPYGFIAPMGAYALAATRHMALYGTSSEQLAEIAVATRKWASMNPKALKREPLSIADVLESEIVMSPLHKLDCCLVTDGGGAIVVTTEERARDLRQKPIWLLGHGQNLTHNNIITMPELTETGAKTSGERAFQMADLTQADIDVVEIYDSFTITVALALEDLGFCKKGEAGSFVEGQRTAPGGPFPLNTSGGGLSYTHPGMFGIFLLIEAVRQLRGECGERQVQDARTALCHGVGGVLSTHCTAILGRD